MISEKDTGRIIIMTRFNKGTLLKHDQVYQGKIIDLEVDSIEIEGISTIREVVRHPGGVVVLAEVEPDRIPFVRQYRYPIGRDLLELPAGKIDNREDPLISAERELEEETGYRAKSLEKICSFYSTPGFCDELLHAYYTDNVEKSEAAPEFDEHLEIEFYSLSEALTLIEREEIQDGKTVAALLWLARKRFLSR
jgi:ADP-ribose pyrophosphatase